MSEESLRSPEEMPFGEALTELEDIVRVLDSGQLELEESLFRYERGTALLKALQTKLADAKQKVTTLIGELEIEDDTEEE